MKVPNFKSTGFALLDVGVGRSALSKYFSARKPRGEGIVGEIPVNKPIKVMIEAEITDQWGSDDGTSIEFECHVKNMKIKSK